MYIHIFYLPLYAFTCSLSTNPIQNRRDDKRKSERQCIQHDSIEIHQFDKLSEANRILSFMVSLSEWKRNYKSFTGFRIIQAFIV